MTYAPDKNTPWIIAITGASGTCYGRRVLELLLQNFPEQRIDLIISKGASSVMKEEEAISSVTIQEIIGFQTKAVRIHDNEDLASALASGSYLTKGMAIVPCSMKTLASIACGYSDTLISRAADVTIKEQRPLIVVPRETPLSAIHLENMLKLAHLGVKIAPAMPGFYNKPDSVDALVEMMAIRVLDQMGHRIDVPGRWLGLKEAR